MSPVDTQVLMQSISDARAEILSNLSNLSSEFSEFKGTVTENIKNTDKRLNDVENDQKEAKKRQWLHSIVVGLSGVAHHDLSSWFNWKI